jgi:hypothetical protein
MNEYYRRDRKSGDARIAGISRSPLLRLPIRLNPLGQEKNQEILLLLFSPSYDERKWALTVARTLASQVGLLVQLKIFQTIGRFRRVTDTPAIVVEHVARRLGVECGPAFVHPDRTLYRHRPAVLQRLGVTAWGTVARELAQSTMIKTAKARTDPADIINAAVDAVDFTIPWPIISPICHST